ncbi:hypothetical protein F4680DRAFT_446295 [Xylaria scruposa]|nr:hypothetical protein F4680DRAFT_446295 [Xylaria scruposa]
MSQTISLAAALENLPDEISAMYYGRCAGTRGNGGAVSYTTSTITFSASQALQGRRMRTEKPGQEIFPGLAHLTDRLAGKPAPECRHFTPTPVPVTAEASTKNGKTDKNDDNPPALTSAQSQTDTPTPAKSKPTESNDNIGANEVRELDLSSLQSATYFDDKALTHYLHEVSLRNSRTMYSPSILN